MASIPIVNIQDKRIGITASILFMIALGILFYFLKYEIADPPPEPFVQPAVAELTDIEIKKFTLDSQTAAAGSPSDDPKSTPQDQTEQIITKPDNTKSQTNTGSSNKNTPKQNKDNKPTTTNTSKDPFGTGGKNGTTGTGKDKFGKDNSTANENDGKNSGSAERIRLNDPKTSDISSNEDCTVNLKLTIDDQGNVVAAKNLPSKTTTVDTRIINQVIAVVKNQVKYSKSPGSELQEVYLTVKVNAN